MKSAKFFFAYVPVIIFLLLGCAKRVPLENLYEEGVAEELISLSVDEKQYPISIVTGSGTSIRLILKPNRSIDTFISRLNPKGKIEGCFAYFHRIGEGQLAAHNFPWGPTGYFNLDTLKYTDNLSGYFSQSFSKNAFRSQEGKTIVRVYANYTDQYDVQHRGVISNEIEIPVRFVIQ